MDESDANSSCGTSANEFFRQLDEVEVDVSKENLARADQIHKVDATNGLVTDESNSTDESDANSSCGTSANDVLGNWMQLKWM